MSWCMIYIMIIQSRRERSGELVYLFEACMKPLSTILLRDPIPVWSRSALLISEIHLAQLCLDGKEHL